jgi:hypothetical protein
MLPNEQVNHPEEKCTQIYRKVKILIHVVQVIIYLIYVFNPLLHIHAF